MNIGTGSALTSFLQELDSYKPPKPSARQQLLRELASLTVVLQEQQQHNVKLRDKLAYVESALELAEHEQAAQAQRKNRGLPAMGSGHTQLTHWGVPRLNPQGALAATASHVQHRPQVSVWSLPDPGQWDLTWDERVGSLTTLDLTVLHRQWLQELALMLPKAELRGNDSADGQKLLAFMDRYAYFNINAISLAPQAWYQRSKFNLETMEPVQTPSREFFINMMSRRKNKERLQTHFQEFGMTSKKLQAEYHSLLLRHRQLLKEAETSAGGHSHAAQHAAGQLHDRVDSSQLESCRSHVSSLSWQGSHVDPALQCHQMYMCGATQKSASVACSDDRGSPSPNGLPYSSTSLSLDAKALALAEVVSAMQANLARQRLALKQCIYASWQGVRLSDSVDIAKAYVAMYPLLLDTADFLDVLVGAGVRMAASHPV